MGKITMKDLKAWMKKFRALQDIIMGSGANAYCEICTREVSGDGAISVSVALFNDTKLVKRVEFNVAGWHAPKSEEVWEAFVAEAKELCGITDAPDTEEEKEYFIVSGSSTYSVESCHKKRGHAINACMSLATSNPTRRYRVVETVAQPVVKISVELKEED